MARPGSPGDTEAHLVALKAAVPGEDPNLVAAERQIASLRARIAIRKAVYEKVGGLNETDLAVAFNDVDFCLRLREAGYRNVWTPYAELYHHESASRGSDSTRAKRTRFAREIAYMKSRWGPLLLNDPAYSLNLTLYREDFSLAWPPRVEAIALLSQNPLNSQASREEAPIVQSSSARKSCV